MGFYSEMAETVASGVIDTVASTASSATSTSSTLATAAVGGAAVGLGLAVPTALSKIYDSTVGLVQSAPALADFFMGESKTRAEEIHESQRKLEREARRAGHKAWMADQQADAFREKADARARNPAVQEKLAAGLGDRELERYIEQANRLSGRADRIQSTASNLEAASDGIYEVASNVSVLEAASLTTGIIEEANAAMAAPDMDAEDIAERLTEAQDEMKDRTFLVQRALGGQQMASSAQRATRTQMDQYRRQAQQSIMERDRAAKAAAAAGSIAPNAARASVQRREPVADSSPLSASDEALLARARNLRQPK